MVTLGLVALLGAAVAIPMKETFGQPLNDEIEEELSKQLHALDNLNNATSSVAGTEGSAVVHSTN